MITKVCTKCLVRKPLEDFYRGRQYKDGRTYACKSCCADYNQEFPRRDWSRGSYQNHRRKIGYELLFSRQNLEDLAYEADNCKICDVTLNWSPRRKAMGPDSPTMDRINGGTRLTLEHIQIVCGFCNRTKGERTMKEFVEYCVSVVEKFS